MSISAKVICDSISPQRVRLTTLELKFHRFILPEFNTHRMFSRNASSSRAIPIERVLEQVKNSPAMPIHWGKNQPGMQAREETNTLIKGCTREEQWLSVAKWSLHKAELFAESGYHKQIVNRLLEPFQWIKVIVTATEFDNFFRLRLHPDAQPEIQKLARCMKKAMEESTPVELKPGEWHLPYVERRTFLLEDSEITEDLPIGNVTTNQKAILTTEMAIKCSVARCARVSYLNHDNSNPDIEKDIALADKLLEAGHMSPFEHQATPMERYRDNIIDYYWEDGITHRDRDGVFWSSNFKNYIQYRNLI